MRVATLITICMGCWAMADEGAAVPVVLGIIVPDPTYTKQGSSDSMDSTDLTASYASSNSSASSKSTSENSDITLKCNLNGGVITVPSYTTENWENLKRQKLVLICPKPDLNYEEFLKQDFDSGQSASSTTKQKTLSPSNFVKNSIRYSSLFGLGYYGGKTYIFDIGKSIVKFQIAFGTNLGYPQNPLIVGFSYDHDRFASQGSEIEAEVKNWILQFTLIAKQFQFTNLNTQKTLKILVDQAAEVFKKLSEYYKAKDPVKAGSCQHISDLFESELSSLLQNTAFYNATTNTGTEAVGAAKSIAKSAASSALSSVKSVGSKFMNYWRS